ncbi:hypothetical protein ACP4OV_015080 [Aristida adscensionis]
MSTSHGRRRRGLSPPLPSSLRPSLPVAYPAAPSPPSSEPPSQPEEAAPTLLHRRRHPYIFAKAGFLEEPTTTHRSFNAWVVGDYRRRVTLLSSPPALRRLSVEQVACRSRDPSNIGARRCRELSLMAFSECVIRVRLAANTAEFRARLARGGDARRRPADVPGMPHLDVDAAIFACAGVSQSGVMRWMEATNLFLLNIQISTSFCFEDPSARWGALQSPKQKGVLLKTLHTFEKAIGDIKQV